MTGKISYKITVKTPAISEASYGLEFGKSLVGVDSNEILNERPINPENFTDGVLQNFSHTESAKNIGVNPNFMIRQGKLVKSKISGVSIVGESKDKIPPEVLLMGEYKNMASRQSVFVSSMPNGVFDVLDSAVNQYVFKRHKGRVHIYLSEQPYGKSYIQSNLPSISQQVIRTGSYVHQLVGIQKTNILDINGLVAGVNIKTKDDVLNQYLKFGIDQMALVDAMDNIELRNFGIVPEQDYAEIRVGQTLFPIDKQSDVLVGIKFGAGITFLQPDTYSINYSTGEIHIPKEVADLAYQNIDLSLTMKRMVKKPDANGNIIEVEEDFSFVDANSNSGSVYQILALYSIAPMTYFGDDADSINKIDIVSENDEIVLLDVDTYDTSVSNFTLSDKRLLLDTGTWDQVKKTFSVSRNHSFLRTPQNNKTIFAESNVPIIINGHRVFDKKRLVFKQSVLNSLWCKAQMDPYDLTVPIKMTDFTITDVGNGISRYEFTSQENIVPESASILGRFRNGIIDRMQIGADVNRPTDKLQYQYSTTPDGVRYAEFTPHYEADIYDSQHTQYKYLENDNKGKNYKGDFNQGPYNTRKWTLSQFFIDSPIQAPVEISAKELEEMTSMDKRIQFQFKLEMTGGTIMLPSWPQLNTLEVFKINRRYFPDGQYADQEEPFTSFKVQYPDILVINPNIPTNSGYFRVKYNHALYPKIFHVDVQSKKFAFYAKTGIDKMYHNFLEFRAAISRAGEIRFGYINNMGQVVYVPEKMKFEIVFTPDYLRFNTLKYKEVLW